ncbi:glycosyltransferase family 2 protein [Cellulomonas sp. ICMP 17802]|uniref:glycosyltransferase family 2 protein n=1 Tax=Cellulomonas sp. ICMP 17802 TaxID=3239199 RepID=UPI00351B37AE
MREQQTWQRRSARLGWVTLGLTVLAVALLAIGVWVIATAQPAIVPEDPQQAVALLPVDVHVRAPRASVVLGVGLAVAAFVVGMVALQSAAAMRVLSSGRRVSEPLPGSSARMARLVLGSTAVRRLALEEPPSWPLSAIPEEASSPMAVRCTVLIPAHDEEAVLGLTLASLRAQRRPPDRILVVADNCTDATVDIARQLGVEVVETQGNTQHKAGALNQVLQPLLAGAGVDDVVLVMDADSTISPDYLETALGLLESDPDLMAVGGLFAGEEGARVLGQMQRNEYLRYQRVLGRREGRVFVLTGTASVFRGYALRAVSEARGSLIPGRAGDVYDTLALTEDNELTLALKSLGAEMTSPPQCRVTTEVMGTWRDLARQRLRWQRGALENVGAYGITRTTAPYWAQQLALAYGVVALNSYFLLMAVALLASDSVRWSPLWVAIGLLFLVDRVVTAWAAGWPGRLLAVPVLPELGYSWFLQLSLVTAFVQIGTHRKAGWNYVPRPALAFATLPLLAVLARPLASSVLPSSILQSSWFEALSLFVGVNTLVFAVLAVFQLLPPIRKSYHRIHGRRGVATVGVQGGLDR